MHHPSIHPSWCTHCSLGAGPWQVAYEPDKEPYTFKCTGFLLPKWKVKNLWTHNMQGILEKVVCHTESPRKNTHTQSERERERERRKNPFTLTQERWVGTNLPAKKHMTVNPMHEVLKKLWMDTHPWLNIPSHSLYLNKLY